MEYVKIFPTPFSTITTLSFSVGVPPLIVYAKSKCPASIFFWCFLLQGNPSES